VCFALWNKSPDATVVVCSLVAAAAFGEEAVQFDHVRVLPVHGTVRNMWGNTSGLRLYPHSKLIRCPIDAYHDISALVRTATAGRELVGGNLRLVSLIFIKLSKVGFL
jgi:hypothetical protein